MPDLGSITWPETTVDHSRIPQSRIVRKWHIDRIHHRRTVFRFLIFPCHCYLTTLDRHRRIAAAHSLCYHSLHSEIELKWTNRNPPPAKPSSTPCRGESDPRHVVEDPRVNSPSEHDVVVTPVEVCLLTVPVFPAAQPSVTV